MNIINYGEIIDCSTLGLKDDRILHEVV